MTSYANAMQAAKKKANTPPVNTFKHQINHYFKPLLLFLHIFSLPQIQLQAHYLPTTNLQSATSPLDDH